MSTGNEVVVRIPKAFKKLKDRARIKCFYGGRGSGKSESVARYLLMRGKEEKMNILCCREFQTSIKQSVHSTLSDLVEQLQLQDFYIVLDTEIRGANGTRFTFAGLRLNIANIKSMHDIKLCWVEEAQVLSENSINVLLPTIRAEDSEIILTMNPILPDDPAYVRFVLNPPKDSVVVKVNYTENPFFPVVLEKERQDLLERDPIAYRNVWLGEPREAVEGAIFARELQKAQDEGRITNVPYDPTVPVCTYWDLGKSALTAIWFVQYVGMQWRVLRHYSAHLEELNHYIKYVQTLPYVYSKHYLPHDGEHKRIGMVLSVKEQVAKALGHVQTVPRIHQKADAINAAKQIMSLCVFDKEGCADGLSDLRHYAYRVTEDGKISNEPEEGNFYRDTADAFMTFAQSCIIPKPPKDELEEMMDRQRKQRTRGSGAWWV